MYGLMTTTYVKLRRAVGIQTPQDVRKGILPEPVSDAELEALLRSSRPAWGAAIGVVGLIVIIWLMEMKPF